MSYEAPKTYTHGSDQYFLFLFLTATMLLLLYMMMMAFVPSVRPHASSNNPNAPTLPPAVDNRPNCSDVQAEAASQPDPSIGEQVVFMGLVPILGILAFFGGAFSCVTLFHQNIRVPPNKYLAGMAIGDIGIGLSAICNFAFKLVDIDYFCKSTAQAYVVKGAVYVGVMGGRVTTANLILLGLQRAVAVWRPELLKGVAFTSFATVFMLVSTSICIFVAPGTFEIIVDEVMIYHTNSTLYMQMGPSFGALYPANTNGIILTMVLSVALVLVSLSLTIASGVGLKVKRGDDDDDDMLKENHVSLIYVIIGSCYATCYLPSAILACVALAVPGFELNGDYEAIFTSLDYTHYILEILNAALHLPFYVAFYVHFRDTISVALSIKKPEDAQVLWVKTDENI